MMLVCFAAWFDWFCFLGILFFGRMCLKGSILVSRVAVFVHIFCMGGGFETVGGAPISVFRSFKNDFLEIFLKFCCVSREF